VGAKISTQPESVAHRIFDFGKPMVIADLAADSRLKVPRRVFAHDVVSGLIAPIIRGSVPFEIVGAFSTSHRRFNPADIDFFRSATNLLSSALENEHLRREIARATAKAEREAASKVSFIANASHELRSPLNVILGYCEIIGELLKETGDPHAQGWMQAVERAGIRVLGTVDDIFDYSRIESGTVPRKCERLQLAPLVEAVVRAATPAAVAKRIGLSCSIELPGQWLTPTVVA
jgi:signal transduction histidine kinase